jgi:hypothetical protein
MKITTNDKIIAWLTLLSGLTISAVAVWYSVAGLVSIFAAAAVPIIIMGVALEVSKLIATVWLKLNWQRAPLFIKTYLMIAIAILMVITSMGIFGFLSKAHSDQSLVSGDVQAKIAVYDEKIKTAKDNIDANRKAIKQMDEAVDQVMGRSSDEKGADKAVAVRRAQQKERVRLQSEIASEQKTITALSEERAPIAAEVRKVEAEVGPIKYIAAFVYGDNPDANVLEKAVTWVIIIIVSVFDPLAVILLLASQYSFQWFRKQDEEDIEVVENVEHPPNEETLTAEQLDQINTMLAENAVVNEPTEVIWPFPTYEEITPKHTEKEVPSETPLTALGGDITAPEEPVAKPAAESELDKWNKMIEEAEKAASAETEKEDEQILDEAQELEKAAMTAWKRDNPESSLKIQRRLLERGIIKSLPWEDYLKAQPDFSDDEAAQEAAKWALEQIEESKKKDSDMDGTSGSGSDQEKPRRIAGYVQNAEQNEKTIWQRVKDSKKDL